MAAFEAELFPASAAKQTRMPVVPEGARRSTLNINSVHGGQTEDFLPGLPARPTSPIPAGIIIDRRFLLEEDIGAVKQEVTSILERLARERPKFVYEIRDVMEVLPLMTEPDAPVAARRCATASAAFSGVSRTMSSRRAPTTRSTFPASATSTTASPTDPAFSTSPIGPTSGSASPTWSTSAKVMAIGLDVLLQGGR